MKFRFRDEVLEALKLAEILVPPPFRGLYQVVLAGFESAWKEMVEDTDNEDSTDE